MLPRTVETANDLLANSRLFRRINGVHHAFRQPGEFVSCELTLSVELIGKPNDAQLLLRIEPFNFLDDLSRGHT